MTHGLSAVWRVKDLYGKWVTINSSIDRWKKLNCPSQVVIAYKCSQLTSESADAKAAFSFAGSQTSHNGTLDIPSVQYGIVRRFK